MGFCEGLRISQLLQKILEDRSELLALELEMSDQLELLAIHHCEPSGTQSFLKRALLLQLQRRLKSELPQAGDLLLP